MKLWHFRYGRGAQKFEGVVEATTPEKAYAVAVAYCRSRGATFVVLGDVKPMILANESILTKEEIKAAEQAAKAKEPQPEAKTA